jgi:hypothetical protein
MGVWQDIHTQAVAETHGEDYMLENGYFQNEHGQWEKLPTAEWVKVL